MKHILVMLLILFSCNMSVDSKKTLNDTISIDFIEFNQNPAMEYFFTRKYKLTNEQLFYYKNNSLQKTNAKSYLLVKKLIDSLPQKVINEKRHLGHPTVMIDVPDWSMKVFLSSKDTIIISSGGLPSFMKNYEKIVWDIIPKLDNLKL